MLFDTSFKHKDTKNYLKIIEIFKALSLTSSELKNL